MSAVMVMRLATRIATDEHRASALFSLYLDLCRRRGPRCCFMQGARQEAHGGPSLMDNRHST
jgi:hypothetical protein